MDKPIQNKTKKILTAEELKKLEDKARDQNHLNHLIKKAQTSATPVNIKLKPNQEIPSNTPRAKHAPKRSRNESTDRASETEFNSPERIKNLEEENQRLKSELETIKSTLYKIQNSPTNRFAVLADIHDDQNNHNNQQENEPTKNDWQTAIKNRNCKRSPPSPAIAATPKKQKQKQNNQQNENSIIIENKKQTQSTLQLQRNQEQEAPSSGVPRRDYKLPPINITGQNIKDTIKVLTNGVETTKFNIKRINQHRHLLTMRDYNEHKKAKELFDQVQTQYFTFTPRQEKAQTILLKGLDSAYDPIEVLELLKDTKIPGLTFTSVKKFTTPKSIKDMRTLPIYLVQLSADSIIGKLHEIKFLDYQLIRWEKLEKRDIIQCKNCQRLGHAAFNCRMKYRCVKCNDPHGPGECQIGKNSEISKEQLYCVLCQKIGHPASYKGCPKHEQYKNSSEFKATKNKNRQPTKSTAHSISNMNLRKGVSFADTVKNKFNEQKQDQNQYNIIDSIQTQIFALMQMFQTNSEKIDKLYEIVTNILPNRA